MIWTIARQHHGTLKLYAWSILPIVVLLCPLVWFQDLHIWRLRLKTLPSPSIPWTVTWETFRGCPVVSNQSVICTYNTPQKVELLLIHISVLNSKERKQRSPMMLALIFCTLWMEPSLWLRIKIPLRLKMVILVLSEWYCWTKQAKKPSWTSMSVPILLVSPCRTLWAEIRVLRHGHGESQETPVRCLL